MLFNSFSFALFFLLGYPLYLLLGTKAQNRFLLAASYLFYATWDWRFLSLILLSTGINYYSAIAIGNAASPARRKGIVTLAVTANLTILGIFKYLNFFTENLAATLRLVGLELDIRFFDIILPVGISFYTFQSMSYVLDVYRKEVKATDRVLDFALYVAFFPQLLSGPIERARHFLPQILNPRKVTLEHVYQGAFLIFWGLFLKAFVADNLSYAVNPVYGKDGPYTGAEVLLATYAYTFQIFCDFAGYSSMAQGLAKVMGFDIVSNFNLPFFATNIQEYWNRWHISLSSWLRDYVYMPLLGSMRRLKGNNRIYAAVIITMTLIGLWHGAAWTYVVFGVYYGVLLALYVRFRMKRRRWIDPKGPIGQGLWKVARMAFVFHLVVIGMLLFRARDLAQGGEMLYALFANFGNPLAVLGTAKFIVVNIWFLMLVQIFQYWKNDLLCVYKSGLAVRIGFYLICTYYLTMHGVTNGGEFIYFQF